jgi:hypothetical protein
MKVCFVFNSLTTINFKKKSAFENGLQMYKSC